ncbi:ATP-binding protein [Parachryseolinea silvisoli]|uniref:ATP-binding protein n=1 Tax=Parachryseolinea silvisoli TaxID=2873601 RepID=UPI002265BF6C|nr:tetratricopeptide repeat protein [Parachryseolinea silvisoli]MCD9019549.1 tetratricopeptide repeat protein [Parachryseolinea silvisoli]
MSRMLSLRVILTTMVLATCGLSQAQTPAGVDSLENVVKSSNLPDSVRLDALTRLSDLYQFVDFARSVEYSEEAIALAANTDLPLHKIKAYRNAALLYTISGDYSSALRYDNLALELDMIVKDSVGIAKEYNAIGNDYYDLGEYDDAYFYFTQSHRMASATRDTLRMLIALHNVGRVFKELGQFEQALDHLQLSKKLSETQNDQEGIPYGLYEIGDVLLRKHEYDSALATLREALALVRKLHVDIIEPKVLSTMATAYLQQNDYKNALAFYDSAYALHQKTTNRYGMAEANLGRGIVLTKEGNFEKALEKFEASLSVARTLNARVLEIKAFNQLSVLWEQEGDFKKALYYYKQYKQLEDTLFSQETQGKLLRDQIRFETESRDTQIAALSQLQVLQHGELKKQEFVRNILVVVMALSAILLVTVYRSGQRRRKINTLLLQHQDDMEKRSEELERLNQVKDKFFSIISHDLRSPINALAGLLDLIDKGAIEPAEMHKHTQELKVRFNHTRTLLNNLLDWTLLQMDKLSLQAARINLRKIVDENIQLLISVQNKQIDMINHVPTDAIGYADSNTINLVIRNLMMNAIKFTNDGGKVIIDAKSQPSEWLFSVKDNGVGMKPEVLNMLFDKTAPYTTRGTANEKGTGLGLILCKEFIEKNGGRIWVESEEGQGSTFFFTVPKAD